MRLLLALLAALVLAPVALAADPLVVTNFDDVTGPRQPPLPGSLRYILEEKAKPHDIITFQTPSEIRVIGPIIVPKKLHDVVIDGASQTGRAAIRSIAAGRYVGGAIGLTVLANRVTVRNMVFNDSALRFGEETGGGKVHDSLFMGARGALLVDKTAGMVVSTNVFEGRSEAMDADLVDGGRIEKNRFAGPLQAEGADRLFIQSNEFTTGRSFLTLDGGGVLGNTFTGGSLILRTIVDNDAIRGVRVASNTATGGGTFGFTAGGGLVVEGNTFTGVQKIELGCIPNPSRGPELRFVNNAVVGGRGVVAGENCRRKSGRIDIASTRIEGTSFAGLSVVAGEVRVRSSTFTGGAGGIVVNRGAEADIRGGQIVGNRGAGVFINRSPRATIVSRVVMGGNAGPGIDRVPVGVSPRAAPGAPTLVYDEKKGKLRGRACPRCLVEIFESEEGAKLGNPGYGEGIRLLGVVKANGLGRFVFPARGDFDCPPSGLVTATATHTLKGTSEFSADEPCACVISSRFGVDASRVPTTGFGNYGIEVFFEPGTVVKAAELTDTATDLRPPDNALGPSFGWDELRVEPPVPGASYAFLVNVGYNAGAPAPATWPLQVWRFRVPYEPPPEAKGACRAVLDFVYLPPPPE